MTRHNYHCLRDVYSKGSAKQMLHETIRGMIPQKLPEGIK